MKKMAGIMMALFALFVAATAEAKEYKVVKGDTLTKIAAKFEKQGVTTEEILKANPQIKRPKYIVRLDETLIIPVKDDGKKKSKGEGKRRVWRWKHVGANPCTNCDQLEVFRDVLQKMQVPREVRDHWFKQVGNKESKPRQLKSGDRFNQMVFGNKMTVLDNVLADWGPAEYDADLYNGIEYEGRRYFLVMPKICKNWSWWSEPVTGETPKVAPPAVKKEEQATPAPAAPIRAPKLLLPTLPTETPKPAPPAAETPAPEPPHNEDVLKSYDVIKRGVIVPGETVEGQSPWDWEMSSGYFHENLKGTSGNVSGEWFSATLYPWISGNPKSQTSFGFDVEQVSYKGVSETDYHYSGHKYSFGPAIRYQTNRSETILKGGYMWMKNEGNISPSGSGGEYTAKENTKGYSWYFHWKYYLPSRFFALTQFTANGDIYASGKKNANWTQGGVITPQDNTPADKTSTTVKITTHLWEFTSDQTVALTAGIGETYTKENGNRSFRAQIGLAFFKEVAEVKFYHDSNSKTPDSNGVEGMINVTELWRKAFSNQGVQEVKSSAKDPLRSGDTVSTDDIMNSEVAPR